MGYNGVGELGDTTFNNTNRPELIATNVTAIAAGYYHSLFLKTNGSLWAMGWNYYGQLGDGSSGTQTNIPEMIVPGGVTAIAAGYAHSLFLKSDGSLWAMGYNNFGQLGDGTTNNVATPEMILPGGVAAIAAGYAHSLFLKTDGTLWTMGRNDYGQLGIGSYTNTNRPVQSGLPGGYNQISLQLLSGGKVLLSFIGNASANYALDRSFNLAPPNWVPQLTNPANSSGSVVFTNTPNAATNNFWRVRSVP